MIRDHDPTGTVARVQMIEALGRANERELELTDSERTLAVMLDAWDRWSGFPDRAADTRAVLYAVGRLFGSFGLVSSDEDDDRVDLTPKGRDLLDRARKAGVL